MNQGLSWRPRTPSAAAAHLTESRRLTQRQTPADGATRHDNGHVPSPVRSFIRWIIPHIAIIVGAAAEAASSDPVPLFVTPASWMLAALFWWLLVPASSRWDAEGRGWNDKAAGTIVVASPW